MIVYRITGGRGRGLGATGEDSPGQFVSTMIEQHGLIMIDHALSLRLVIGVCSPHFKDHDFICGDQRFFILGGTVLGSIWIWMALVDLHLVSMRASPFGLVFMIP